MRTSRGCFSEKWAVAVGLLLTVAWAAPAYATDCIVTAGVSQSGGVIVGTEGNDIIDCSGLSIAEPRVIYGLGGNDILIGAAPIESRVGQVMT